VDMQSHFQETSYAILVTEFIKEYEIKLHNILNIGTEFLQSKISLSQFLSTTDQIRNDMETLEENFQKETKDENPKSRKGVERGSTVSDVDSVMETSENLRKQQSINDELSNQLKKALTDITDLQEKVKKSTRQIEDKNTSILTYQVELKNLTRSQKENNSILKSKQDEVEDLMNKIIQLKAMKNKNEDSQKIKELRNLLYNLSRENDTLKNKLSLLEEDVKSSYNKVFEITQTLSSNVKNRLITEEAGKLKELIQGLLNNHKGLEAELKQLQEKEKEQVDLTNSLDKEIKKLKKDGDKISVISEQFLQRFELLDQQIRDTWERIERMIDEEYEVQ